MNKRAWVLTIALIFITGVCVAENPRAVVNDISNTDAAPTVFKNISITGLDGTNNPGFIQIVGQDLAGVATTYYLYVDYSGDLRIASHISISAFASFPTGDWSTDEMNVGTVVGSQS